MTRWLRGAVLTVTAAMILAGCSGTPLSPTSINVGSDFSGRSAPELAGRPTNTGGGGTGGTGTNSGTGAATVLTEAQVNALLGGSPVLTASASVVGTSGGSVNLGRFRVTVPAGAFKGTGVVTIRMSGPSSTTVDLGITPANLNDFRKPVLLTFNTTGLTTADPLTIFWYNPSTKSWVDMGVRPDPITGFPTASLQHFSVYRAGKAGW